MRVNNTSKTVHETYSAAARNTQKANVSKKKLREPNCHIHTPPPIPSLCLVLPPLDILSYITKLMKKIVAGKLK